MVELADPTASHDEADQGKRGSGRSQATQEIDQLG